MKDDLQETKDWLAICQAMARFCRTLDTKDWASFADLHTEDFELDVAEDTHMPLIKGRDAVLKAVQAAMVTATTVHQVHAPEMTITGDNATVTWAMQDRVIAGPKGRSFTGYGHYHTRWVRQNGAWKMASLKLTRLHIDVDPPAQQ